jgi:hypothetical protein
VIIDRLFEEKMVTKYILRYSCIPIAIALIAVAFQFTVSCDNKAAKIDLTSNIVSNSIAAKQVSAYGPGEPTSGIIPHRVVESNYTPPPAGFDIYRPFPLQKRLADITHSFQTSVLAPGQEMQPNVSYVENDREIIVSYPANCSLDVINNQRIQLSLTHDNVVKDPNGYYVEATEIDPQTIMASYAQSLPTISSTQQVGAFQGNETYLTLSRYIAAKYSLTLVKERYYETSNSALFMLPAGQSPVTLALAIQNENNDFVMCVSPNKVFHTAAFEPRTFDPRLDFNGEVGHGVKADGNGPFYWDGGECFNVFMHNAHLPQSSFYTVSSYDFDGAYPNGGLGYGAGAFVLDTGASFCTASLSAYDLPYNVSTEYPIFVKPTLAGDEDFWDVLNLSETLVDLDYNHHGTRVSSIIAARGGNGHGMVGMLPFGQVYPIRASRTGGDYWNLKEARDRALEYSSNNNGPYVMNISWATADTSSISENDRDWLTQLQLHPKVMVVFAAGNSEQCVATGYQGSIYNPIVEGIYPQALAVYSDQIVTVGGMEYISSTEQRWSQTDARSNYRRSDDRLLKRAVTISGLARNVSTCSVVNDHETWNPYYGTSFAAPAVVGAIALLQSYNQWLTPTDIRRHLEISGRYTQWGTANPLPGFTEIPGYEAIVPILDMANSTSWIAITDPENPTTAYLNTPIHIQVEIGVNAPGDDQRQFEVEYYYRQGSASPVKFATCKKNPYDVWLYPQDWNLQSGALQIQAVMHFTTGGATASNKRIASQLLTLNMNATTQPWQTTVLHNPNSPSGVGALSTAAIGKLDDDTLLAEWSLNTLGNGSGLYRATIPVADPSNANIVTLEQYGGGEGYTHLSYGSDGARANNGIIDVYDLGNNGIKYLQRMEHRSVSETGSDVESLDLFLSPLSDILDTASGTRYEKWFAANSSYELFVRNGLNQWTSYPLIHQAGLNTKTIGLVANETDLRYYYNLDYYAYYGYLEFNYQGENIAGPSMNSITIPHYPVPGSVLETDCIGIALRPGSSSLDPQYRPVIFCHENLLATAGDPCLIYACHTADDVTFTNLELIDQTGPGLNSGLHNIAGSALYLDRGQAVLAYTINGPTPTAMSGCIQRVAIEGRNGGWHVTTIDYPVAVSSGKYERHFALGQLNNRLAVIYAAPEQIGGTGNLFPFVKVALEPKAIE